MPLLHIIRKGYNMWNIDLSFLQESAQIFLDEFVHKYYRIYTKSGQVFLVIFKCRNSIVCCGDESHFLHCIMRINDNLNMYINDHLRMYTSDYALI